MPKFPCPICGDPNAYPLWIDEKPPEGCPQDEAWHEGRPPQIKNVTECPYQMGKAKQRARWMKVCPEAFDENGKLKDGMLAYVLERAQPRDEPLII